MQYIHADMTVSVSELKRNFAQIVEESEGYPVAVLNHNKPEAYLLSPAHYEHLLQHYEDALDSKMVEERSAGPFVAVSLDEL